MVAMQLGQAPIIPESRFLFWSYATRRCRRSASDPALPISAPRWLGTSNWRRCCTAYHSSHSPGLITQVRQIFVCTFRRNQHTCPRFLPASDRRARSQDPTVRALSTPRTNGCEIVQTTSKERCRMPRVLITGGGGFIGSHVAGAMLDAGYDVRLLDNLSPQIHGP